MTVGLSKPGVMNPQQDVTDRDIVSVILPVFNERENLEAVIHELSGVLAGVEHEIIAVDDGSTDGSVAVLQELTGRFRRLRVVARPHLGQSAGLAAGFEAAKGATIVTLDADGQNDPADIPALLDLMDDSVAVVGVRSNRAASHWKRIQARIANTVRDFITGDRVQDTGCALRVARRVDLLRLPRFKGMHRFVPTLLRRQGVTVVEVPVNDRHRQHGVSKYGMWNRVFVGLLDALGVRWLRLRSF